MNRRSFLTSLIKASVGCSILPAATTYARTWKSTPQLAYDVVTDPLTGLSFCVFRGTVSLIYASSFDSRAGLSITSI